jgi:hypothetical protein
MAKILTDKELLDIVRRVVEDSELDGTDEYNVFIRDVAEVITDWFGGSVGCVSYEPDDGLGIAIAIHRDSRVPSDGGIYAKYDTEADFETEDKP